MSVYRYFRLKISSSYGGSTLYVGNVELRESAVGANLSVAGNGTASASKNTATANLAFNGLVTAPFWSVSGATYPEYLYWDFGEGSAYDIRHLKIRNGDSYSSYQPLLIELQGSNDNAAWTLLMSGTNGSGASTVTTFEYIPPAYATDLSLPALLLSSDCGGASSSTLPALGLSAFGGAQSKCVLPSLTASARGHDSTGEQAANITLPSLSASARAGSNTRLALPSLASQAAGTVTGSARADISLPSLNAQAGATVAGSAGLAISLPSLSGKSYAGALCSVTIGKLSMKATGTTGAIGRAKVILPLFDVVSVATAQNHGSVDITLPSLAMGATVRAAISLPGLTLTAIGTAVIAVSYEAYAVNLLRSIDRNPNNNYIAALDEVTHYTNYPFTHVVRYQGSYYGANSTGLYLLEGTTDDGVAIPFAVKTAVTDFKTPNKKTLASAYFSGRFGPASTISLHEGEKAPNTYSFTTPRGTLAQNHRQKFGKGTKGRYFALSVSGTGTCELDGIEPEVHQLTRRI